jgi:predicted house-cleaning noncanonical NTP pyrophosphatase (MazG superfamily)
MKITELTTRELHDLLERIREELNKRKLQEKAKLLNESTRIASKRGYSLKDLIGKTSRSAKGKKAVVKNQARKLVPAKYRDPQHPNLTWMRLRQKAALGDGTVG